LNFHESIYLIQEVVLVSLSLDIGLGNLLKRDINHLLKTDCKAVISRNSLNSVISLCNRMKNILFLCSKVMKKTLAVGCVDSVQREKHKAAEGVMLYIRKDITH